MAVDPWDGEPQAASTTLLREVGLVVDRDETMWDGPTNQAEERLAPIADVMLDRPR